MKKLGFIFAMTALFSLGLSAQDGTKPKPKAGTAAQPKTATTATPKNTVPAKTPAKTPFKSKGNLVKVGHPVKVTTAPTTADRVNTH